MQYRVEVGTPDEIKTTYPADRAAALAEARKLSVKNDSAYVVGFDNTGDLGQIVYANGRQDSRDGVNI
jgi:hypothetical protein